MRVSTRHGPAACGFVMALTTTLVACATDRPSVVEPRQLVIAEARGSGDTQVSTYVADAEANGSAFQIRSDGRGVYRTSTALNSIIQPIGAWVLELNSRTSTRSLVLDFGQPVPGSGPSGGDPIAVASGPYMVRAIAKCNVYGTSMLTLAPGATMACPLHIAFGYNGSSYALQMNPNPTGADPDGAPETDWATVTCLTPTSGSAPCTEWTLTPSDTYTAEDGSVRRRNVARLIKYVTSKGTTTNVNQGDFYVSFAIRLTNP